jgi:hypothetical protein
MTAKKLSQAFGNVKKSALSRMSKPNENAKRRGSLVRDRTSDQAASLGSFNLTVRASNRNSGKILETGGA